MNSELSSREVVQTNDHLASDMGSTLDFREQTLSSHAISIRSAQADQAVLEAAMSSAVHHPNIVHTYHYQTLEADERRPVRVSACPRISPSLLSSSPLH